MDVFGLLLMKNKDANQPAYRKLQYSLLDFFSLFKDDLTS